MSEALRPVDKLYLLYSENKINPSQEYLAELIAQLKLFATEWNTVTKDYVKSELKKLL